MLKGNGSVTWLYLSQPILRRECGEKPKERLPKRKTCESHHQRLLEENVRKTKKRFANFENKGLRVVYAWGANTFPMRKQLPNSYFQNSQTSFWFF